MRELIQLIVINGFVTVRCIIKALDSMASSSYVNKVAGSLPPACGPGGALNTHDTASLLAAAKFLRLVNQYAPTAKFLHVTEVPDFLVAAAGAHEQAWGGHLAVMKAIRKQIPNAVWAWKWGGPSHNTNLGTLPPATPGANLGLTPIAAAAHTPSGSSSGDESSESGSKEGTNAEEEWSDPFDVSPKSGSASESSSEHGSESDSDDDSDSGMPEDEEGPFQL